MILLNIMLDYDIIGDSVPVFESCDEKDKTIHYNKNAS